MDNKRISGIRNRIFLSYSSILLSAVIVFVVILLQIVNKNSIDTSLQNLTELTSVATSQVDNFLIDMDSVALSVSNNPQLLAFFIEFSEDDDMSNYFSTNIMDYTDISSLLGNINGPLHTVDRISVFNNFGDHISTGILFEDKNKISERLSDIHEIEELSLIMKQKDSGNIILGPHADFWSTLPNEIVSVFRPVSNRYAEDSYGVVEVQRNVSKLESALSFSKQQAIVTLIFDENGDVIYSSSPNKEDYVLYYDYMMQGEEKGVSGIVQNDTPSKEYITYGQSSVSGWKIALVQSRGAMLKPFASTFIALILGAIVLSIILCLVAFIVADRISYPIRMLSDSIQSVNFQNITINEMETSRDEVYALQSAFKAMFEKLSQSATLELQSSMLALQSQMNPHFLYNMLAVISATGQEIGNEKIVDMCSMVSSMLRYTASHSDVEVVLQDELKHAKAYLELMKQRYEDDFSYSIEVDEEIQDATVPKLILQPIVENCFQHGFKDVLPPWRIHIKAYSDSGKWYVRVSDNGSGMSDEKIEMFFTQLDEYKSNPGYPKLEPGGMGMLNTAIRLFIMYENNDTFTISRSYTGGAIVTIGGLI